MNKVSRITMVTGGARSGKSALAEKGPLAVERRGKKIRLEFPDTLSEADLRAALDHFLAEHFRQ